MTGDSPFWRRKSLHEMTGSEWESLCDGCGRCCLNKLEEEGTDRTFYTNVGCRLLDEHTCRYKDYKNRSALTYVTNIRTPMAFILGETDYRTPPTAGGETLFRALKWLKRPTAMVRFPGESHELSRSGQPWHRVERLQSIVGWMDKYLLGKDVPQFKDVSGEEAAPPPPPAKKEKPRRKKKH